MARKAGIDFLDTLSRVMTEGNREKPIVNNDRDQKQYLDKLKNEEEKIIIPCVVCPHTIVT